MIKNQRRGRGDGGNGPNGHLIHHFLHSIDDRRNKLKIILPMAQVKKSNRLMFISNPFSWASKGFADASFKEVYYDVIFKLLLNDLQCLCMSA